MSDAIEVKYCRPEELIPDPENPRDHSEADIGFICKSIQVYGFTNPVQVQAGTKIIAAGHGRREAAIRLKLDKIPYIEQPWDDALRKGYSIADNKSQEKSSWNFTKLTERVLALDSINFDLQFTGFEQEEIEKMMNWTPEPGAQPGSGESKAGGRGLGTPIVQYNIVFDDETQQDWWFKFLRLLKERYSQETLGARLADFIKDTIAEGIA